LGNFTAQSCHETITQLFAELDNQEVARAIDRLEKGHGLRVVN
jgi:hypothetical protein